MKSRFDVGVIVGSLRAASVTRRLAEGLIRSSPASLTMRPIEIGDLPLSNIAPVEDATLDGADLHVG